MVWKTSERPAAADPSPPSFPPLVAVDRCDASTAAQGGGRASCGARAAVRYVLPSGFDLVFCAHHGARYATGLRAAAAKPLVD